MNVIRECGRLDVKNPYEDGEMGFSFNKIAKDEPADIKGDVEMIGEEQMDSNKQGQQQYDFYEHIEKAYEWNSARLLELIMGECQLVQRLESINNYFFFKRGDVFSHFIDGCEEILESFSSDVKMEKIESLLEMAVRTSSANSDPFKDDVTCVLNSYGLSE